MGAFMNQAKALRWLYLIALLLSMEHPESFAFDNGQYGDVPDNIRSWFKGVKSSNGVPCCDMADGHRTTWRGTASGGYEVTIEGEWAGVPPESIVYNAGNPTGEAIVWYVKMQDDRTIPHISQKWHIRCFVPGDGV